MMELVDMLGLGSSSFKQSRGSSPLFGIYILLNLMPTVNQLYRQIEKSKKKVYLYDGTTDWIFCLWYLYTSAK